jgi:hypothetical protein
MELSFQSMGKVILFGQSGRQVSQVILVGKPVTNRIFLVFSKSANLLNLALMFFRFFNLLPLIFKGEGLVE